MTTLIAQQLKIPGINPNAGTINGPITQNVERFNTPAGLISEFLQIAFLIAGFLMFIWLVIGIFQYIFAGGNKDGLAKARKRIIYAIVGFLVVVLSFTLSRYIEDVIPHNNPNVQSITDPVMPGTSP